MSYGEGPLDYAAERFDAECDALRKGRGPESRPEPLEDRPSSSEAA